MFNIMLTKAVSFKGHVTKDYSTRGKCKWSWRKRFHVTEARSGVWFGRTRETTESFIELAGDPTEIRKKQLPN
jgi:hypothetical protein